MHATQALEQWFEQADQSLPALTMTARWVVVVVGCVLLIAGGRLVKTACIAGGAMLGMILGGLTLGFLDDVAVAFGIMIGLGLLGALGAWLVFRAWVAIAAAIVFAIAAPAGVIIWQGTPTKMLSEDNAAAIAQLETRYGNAASQLSEQSKRQVQSLVKQGDRESLQEADQLLHEEGKRAINNARSVVFRNIEDMGDWWQENSTEAQRTLGMAMLIGAGIGFLLGVVLPNHAVAIQSAIVGSVLIVIPGRELIMTYLPGTIDFLPRSARWTLFTMGLITLIGLALQWRFHLRPDDKEEQ